MLDIFNQIDLLSPPITLFHLEKRTHTSKVGGILVIAMLAVSFSYICFLLYELINHKKITSIFHKKFEYEAGHYSFNPSSIFHFIQIFSPEDGGYFDKYDSKYIRAYTTYVHSNFSYGDLDQYDHWVFDTCRKDIDDKDIDPYLFENVENFTNGVCIRHYYNSSERKYYSLEEEGFKWPYLEHGIAQRSNIYLTTIVQKCSNDSIINTLFGPCPTQKDIDNYINKYFGIYLYFTDTQVDPTNYTNPVQKYLQVITTGIGTAQTFVESYIHFSPLTVRTNIGTLFGKTNDINSFYFDFNRKGAANNNEKNYILTKYYHLMQNNIQIYERKYSNLFDVFSEIGGVIQFIFYFFYWINYAYNKYIIAYDTNSLFFSIRDNRSSNKNNINEVNILNKNDIRLFNLRSNYDRNMVKSRCFLSSNHLDNLYNNNLENRQNKVIKNFIFEKEETKFNTKVNNNFNNNRQEKKCLKINNLSKNFTLNKKISAKSHNSSFLSLKEYNNKKLEKENSSFGGIYKKVEINLGRNNKNNIYNLSIINVSKGKIQKNEQSVKNNSTTEDKLKSIIVFSFIDFLKSLLFKRRKGNHYFIHLFRKHLLSEEHILKSHIKMVFLERQHNFNSEENTNVLECFNEL